MAKKSKEPKQLELVPETMDIKSIEKEINKYLDNRKESIVEDISKKIDDQIELNVTRRMKEEEKRILRGKNGKIIRRDILILILIAIISYFSYCLYKVDYFHIRTIKETTQTEEKTPENSTNNEEEVKEEPIKIDYIKEYSYLVDNIQIEDDDIFSLYNKKLTKHSISNELKLKIAYKNISEERLIKDENNNTITYNKEDLLESAKKIFGEDVTLNNEAFTYNNTRFIFFNDAYIGFNEDLKKTNFVYKIVDAKEEENKLIFDVLVAKISENNELLNNKNKIVIEDYQEDDLEEYKDKLSTFKISFTKENDNYIFSSIKPN